jgi:hypothetical protein
MCSPPSHRSPLFGTNSSEMVLVASQNRLCTGETCPVVLGADKFSRHELILLVKDRAVQVETR